MYKYCLVSQLNGNPTFSKDRLTLKWEIGSTLGEMRGLSKRVFQLFLELAQIV
jgi:hypothetical protein